MSILKEFKEFAIKGNAVDMAVGIVIGAAFGKIITSLVEDIIMPPIGVILGGMDFKSLAITIKEAAGESPAVVLAYGKFVQTIVDFTIVAFAMFMIITLMNKLKRTQAEAPAAPAAPPAQEVLLAEIRDLLKDKK